MGASLGVWRRRAADAVRRAQERRGTSGPAPTDNDGAAIAALEQQLAELRHATDQHSQWLMSIQGGVDDIRIGYGAQLSDLDRWARSTVSALNALTTAPLTPSTTLNGAALQRRDPAGEASRIALVHTVSRYLDELRPRSALTVSVVTPTRNRSSYLREAIASVLAQDDVELEHVIVDDASTDDTPAVLAAIDDPRVRTLRLDEHLGGAAARNRALGLATGDVVVYLDDDNLMARGWLRAVTWAFQRWPDHALLYGARIIEDAAASDGTASAAMPSLEFYAYDRRRLERSNFIDMNVIAHRAGIEGAYFDEEVRTSQEWPMMLRLTQHHVPLELPVVGCLYRTSAPHRRAHDPGRIAEANRIRSRIPANRPLRVLCHNAMYPMVTETYIGEEMRALEANGAVVDFSAYETSVSPVPLAKPLWTDLAEAVREVQPDVIWAYWATHAAGELTAFETLGVPFAVRTHSFDMDPDVVRRLAEHPLCVGVWTYPQHASLVPDAHALVPLFGSHDDIGVATERTSVISASAGLPKKDWPTLVAALEQLADLPRSIIVGRTNGFEHVPDDIAAMLAQQSNPPELRVNATRDEVFAALRSAAVCLYTLEPGQRIGMPMSVIEALRAGACVIHPDDPAMRPVLGDSWRPYRSADDIVRQVREVLRGGPAIDAERARNEEWARVTFCDPELGKRLHEELVEAVSGWLLRAGSA